MMLALHVLNHLQIMCSLHVLSNDSPILVSLVLGFKLNKLGDLTSKLNCRRIHPFAIHNSTKLVETLAFKDRSWALCSTHARNISILELGRVFAFTWDLKFPNDTPTRIHVLILRFISSCLFTLLQDLFQDLFQFMVSLH